MPIARDANRILPYYPFEKKQRIFRKQGHLEQDMLPMQTNIPKLGTSISTCSQYHWQCEFLICNINFFLSGLHSYSDPLSVRHISSGF